VASSKRSSSASPSEMVIDAEWSPIEEHPQLPPSPRQSVVKLRVKRRPARGQEAARATAAVVANGCRVCGYQAMSKQVRVGPWKVSLCSKHGGMAFGAAALMRLLIG
jgi:hypothetical protein